MQRTFHPAMLLAAALTAGAPTAPAAAGKTAPPAPAPAAAPAPAKVHPLLGVPVPESVFVNDPRVGKDPFFPDSTRRLPQAPVLTKAPTAPESNRAHLLLLRGISGPPARRIALINNLTFVAGEEGTVRTSAGLLKIRVQSVEEKTVSVLIDGESQPRVLLLNDKIPDSIQIQTSQVEK